MTITTSKRPHAVNTRTLHICLTDAELDRIDRYAARVRAEHPHIRPSRSLVIAEALASLVDGKTPVWDRG